MTPIKSSDVPGKMFAGCVAILGRTGSGKTFAAKTEVEGLLHQGHRVCVIDPTGVWWGLRSSADGKSDGFPVVVFGGDHADVPITDESAERLAELIADRNLPAVIDISEMTRGEQTRFMTQFFDTLYRRNRSPLTLVIDEADLMAPQRPMPQETVLLNRMEQIVRRGRVKGFMPWLITQRPAELHKSVLSQAGTLVAMRLTAPQDREAIGAWIEGQADREEGKKLLAALPKLPVGQGFVWSPAVDFLRLVKFAPITTFDSGRAPEPGASPLKVERLAAVEVSEIAAALRVEPKAEPSNGDYARGHTDGIAAGRAMIATAERLRSDLLSQLESVEAAVRRMREAIGGAATDTAFEPPEFIEVAQVPAKPARPTAPGQKMAKVERLILTALAQYQNGRSKAQVAMLSGYAVGGGSFGNGLSALRTKGYMAGTADLLTITKGGLDALGDFERLPTGAALRAHWANQLPKAERLIFECLCAAHPKAMSKAEVAKRTGYEPGGGSFGNALSRLRTLALITGRGELRAGNEVFQ